MDTHRLTRGLRLGVAYGVLLGLVSGCSEDAPHGTQVVAASGRDAGTLDAASDAQTADAARSREDSGFDFPDFGVDAGPGGMQPQRTPPTHVPKGWSCRADFALDLVCDCGCGASDLGCATPGCAEPDCALPVCDACFGATGLRAPCGQTGAWLCALSRRADGVCDCGCGAEDPDCAAGGCSDWGCNVQGCERCLQDSGVFGACPEPATFVCEPAARENGKCDCGCGNLDPECDALSCTAPGCSAAACEVCRNAAGQITACESQRDVFWCAAQTRGDGVCDCGCGSEDPDCAQAGCSAGSCDAAGCERCHDEFGRELPCASRFTCGQAAYADGVFCDCGCGSEDPDCAQLGCSEPGCTATGCDVRHDEDGAPLLPTSWSCAAADFAADDGCDCGCGASDPDCRARDGGCSTPGCQDARCDSCHTATGELRSCRFTCELSRYGSGDGCDCGCGDADPDCGGLGCSEPGCFAPACERCAGSDGAPGTCERSSCPAATWDNDACDCGCREHDPECAGLPSCVTPDCSRSSCEICHDEAGKAVTCSDWSCTLEKQGGGDGCDCGCGGSDPDCGGLGCAQPGCTALACTTCRSHDGAPMSCAP